MASVIDREEREIEQQDKSWTGPKFVGLGFVTLLIAISLIVLLSTRTGCTLAIVP